MLNKASRNHANILYSIRLPTTTTCKFLHLLIDIRSLSILCLMVLHMFRFMITLAIPWLKPTHPWEGYRSPSTPPWVGPYFGNSRSFGFTLPKCLQLLRCCPNRCKRVSYKDKVSLSSQAPRSIIGPKFGGRSHPGVISYTLFVSFIVQNLPRVMGKSWNQHQCDHSNTLFSNEDCSLIQNRPLQFVGAGQRAVLAGYSIFLRTVKSVFLGDYTGYQYQFFFPQKLTTTSSYQFTQPISILLGLCKIHNK